MLDLRITQIVSFDNDFKNAGFTTISRVRGISMAFHFKLPRLVEAVDF